MRRLVKKVIEATQYRNDWDLNYDSGQGKDVKQMDSLNNKEAGAVGLLRVAWLK